jgi:hypothetical protein
MSCLRGQSLDGWPSEAFPRGNFSARATYTVRDIELTFVTTLIITSLSAKPSGM